MIAIRMMHDVPPRRAGRVYLVPLWEGVRLVQGGMAVYVQDAVPGPMEYKHEDVSDAPNVGHSAEC